MGNERGSRSVIQQIENRYKKMSKGHKAIARYITENQQDVSGRTAAAIGQTVGVSESTVVRFAAELGFSGFPEFMQELRDELRVSMTASQRIKASTKMSQSSDILGDVLLHDADQLRRAYDRRDPEAFSAAVQALLGAERVFVVGVRSSAPLASFLHFYLSLMLDDVRLVATASGSEMIEQIMSIQKGDVYIAISNPRYSTRAIRTTAFAKEAGATTLVITDSPESPLIRYADLSLYAQSDMVSFVDGLVAPFSTITALLAAISLKRETILTTRLDRLETIWNEYTVYDKGLSERPAPFAFTEGNDKK